ncbi:DUF4406 domain-containing protein [Acetanaerobacterium elongatum]|uniref:DUF7768 domain-containing protein n=1 Tax=Acetanaerobacterium elongatum TaxID=258515 RepID=A0A1G9YCQ1_9FIRM|nr:DUF4406 domain-containing protein [Acetanaerobacterium elongatum]SDN06912.1 hypothetical protein SAMN05192585_11091 [Acetanaerobacterium elongatum]
MGINKYNSEGYYDPTAYEAMLNIEKEVKASVFRPMVFICSPYAGSKDGTLNTEQNVSRAQRYSRFAVSRGCIPFAPHLLFPQFMDDDDPKERANAIFFGMVFMSKCQELWVFGRNITRGMAVEIEKAKHRGLPIRYFTDSCEEVK